MILKVKPPNLFASPVITQPDTSAFLGRYEAAELGISSLRESYANVFDQLDALEAEKRECIESIKRLVHGNKQPPAGSNKTHVPCRSEIFFVKVQYKQDRGHYDPAKLPKNILSTPGVVIEVDTEKVKDLDDGKLKYAWVEPQWLTPSCSIERIGK